MADGDAMNPEKRVRGGRNARREERSKGSAVHRPYIVRGIPTYDILSEESLIRIEQTADRILAEIGIELREDQGGPSRRDDRDERPARKPRH